MDLKANGFKNTSVPEKAYFGSNKSAISFLIGGIYLLAYVNTGEDKGVWILQDTMHKGLEGHYGLWLFVGSYYFLRY